MVGAVPVGAGPGRTGHLRWVALGVLCIAVLIVNLDNTILNVALPTLVERLRATTDQLQWIVDAYAMVFGGVMLVGGSLADRFGRRRLFIIGLVIFGVASLGAAFAGGVSMLIAWRAVMGAGAAMTIPAGLSIVNDLFRQPGQRAKAVGIWSGTIGLGIAIGPVAGGLLLVHFWWGSIFLVNLPVVVVGIVGALVFVPESRNESARRPDPAGAVLTVVGLGLILWAIIEGPSRGWGSWLVVVPGVVGAGTLALFVWWELRSDHAMLPMAFFRSRRFSIALLSVGIGVFALLGGLFVQTQFLQFGLGYSPLVAGLCILPIAVVLGAGAVVSPLVVRAIGSKVTAAGGLALVTAGLLEVAGAASVRATYPQVLPGLLLIGLGAGALMPTATDSVLGSITQGDAGVGSAANSTAMQVGGALGVAVVGSVLSTRYQDVVAPALRGHAVPTAASQTILGSLGGALAVARIVGGSLGSALDHVARLGFASGSRSALVVAALVTSAGVVAVSLWLPARPGQDPGGPRGAPGAGAPPRRPVQPDQPTPAAVGTDGAGLTRSPRRGGQGSTSLSSSTLPMTTGARSPDTGPPADGVRRRPRT